MTSASEVVIDVESPFSNAQERAKLIIGAKDEPSLLKEKLVESEGQIQVLSNAYEVCKKETAAKINKLEGQLFILKHELESIKTEKKQVEEQLICKESEAKQLQENNLRLQNQISENEKHLIAKTDKSVVQVSGLQSEANNVSSRAVVLRRSPSKAGGLQILMEDNGSDAQVKDSESKKRVFDEEIKVMTNEVTQSRVEKEKLREKIVELEKRLKEREDDLSTQLKMFDASRNAMYMEITSLTSQVDSLQKELNSLQVEKNELCLRIEKAQQDSKNLITLTNQNSRLTRKIEDQRKTLIEKQVIMDKLSEEHKKSERKHLDMKSNVERKIEEAAQDLRKEFEDNLRILSRRIRVAEQLQVENRDWYEKTKEKYYNDSKELKLYVRKLKDFSLSANDMLAALDRTVLKYEKCNDHFMNRISKVSCALIFTKDCVKRQNNARTQAKDDLDTVFKQLNEKESEILGLREKVWKLKNKVREVEKLVKQKDEAMLRLGEEKREAIRQLCIWMDYHRSNSEHLKKMITVITKRNHKTHP